MTRIHPHLEDDDDSGSTEMNSKKFTDVSLDNVTFSRPTTGDSDSSSNEEPEFFEPSFCEKILNILFCRADLASQKLEHKPVTLMGLFRYAEKIDWIYVVFGILCAICAGISQPALALVSGRISNVLIVADPLSAEFRRQAFENVYIFLGLGGACVIVTYFQFYCFQTVCNRLIARLRQEYVRSIIRQNAGWFDKNHSGVLTSTLNENVERIQEGIGDKLGVLVRGISMITTAVIISFIYDWRITLIMLAMTPLSCAIMAFQSKKMEESTMKELTDVAQAGAIAEESIMGVRTVQAFNGQEEMVDRYRNELTKGKKYSIVTAYWSGLLEGFFFFMLYCFLGIGILYGAYLLKVGAMEKPGDVLICIMSQLLGAYFVGLISPHLMVLLNARVAAAVIYETIDRIPKIDVYSSQGREITNPQGMVEFKNVYFRYPSRKDIKVLNGINLKIHPGQTVALVGHSGCGKSTSVGLLTRLYEPEGGSITIDGVDVQQLNIQYLRHIVGIVQQEPTLFNDTIAENIRISNPEITKERMLEVCKMANAHEFIQSLPKQYDTLIGDGGVQLSGGQKQRIAIARTLARDPKVLLLDEATSALDAESESVVQVALDNAAKGRSTIVIAHRLSTIQNADKIVVFDKGVIVEHGTHHELVHFGGHYANLVKAQQFLPEDESTEEPEKQHIRSRRESTASSNFGREAFVRGASSTNSLLESRRRLAQNFTNAFGNPVDDFRTNVVADEMEINANYNIVTIYKNAQGQYHYMIAGFICALIRGLELPGVGLALTYIFEAFALLPTNPGAMMNRCVRGLGIFIGIGAGAWLFQCIGSIVYALSSENLTIKLRIAAFKNILYQDAGFFDNLANTPGKLITRLACDAPNIKSVIDARMFQVTHCCTAIIISAIIAFIYSWQLALLGIAMLSILAFGEIYLAYKVMIKNMQIANNDEAGRTAIEIIENVKTIQLLTLERHFNAQYLAALKKKQALIRVKCLYESFNNCFAMSFEPFMYAACYALGIHIINDGQKSSADVFQAITGMLFTAFAVTMSSSYFPEFVKANSAAKLLFTTINRQPQTGDSRMGEKAEIHGTISFDKVQFTYPQKPNQPVMTSLSFKALPGQTVALVGPSGTGKSTIISMLERFYDVIGGSLKIDGRDVRALSLDHLRTKMALVGQEPRLFAGTIRQNICFGLKDAVGDDEIQKALTLANAQRFIANLPAGIETEVGEKGTQMSGGQKQRIAIARALIRNPKILLLDEATSALDSESERAVQEALDKAREGRTCITIAHRLSSIQNSDVILYIDKGKVQEAGTHSELMAMKGKYFQLIKKQDLNG